MEYEKIRDEILRHVTEDLTEKRRKHTLGVRDTAVRMALEYGADPLKAEIAALGHDLYRGLKGE
ncbi:MAG: HD domain-containing protein, partial [Firmicutes bacterium]|nr:HD domain-containing protein [Bacillota bacterium]